MRRIDPLGKILFPRTTRALALIERTPDVADINGYYRLLGIPSDSSPDEIRRAYRRLARQHHPDAGGDIAGFLAIVEAYNVLMDEEQRALYDSATEGKYISRLDVGVAVATNEKKSVDIVKTVVASAYGVTPFSYYVDGVVPDEQLLMDWFNLLVDVAIECGVDVELRMVLTDSGSCGRVERSAAGIPLVVLNQMCQPDRQMAKQVIETVKDEYHEWFCNGL